MEIMAGACRFRPGRPTAAASFTALTATLVLLASGWAAGAAPPQRGLDIQADAPVRVAGAIDLESPDALVHVHGANVDHERLLTAATIQLELDWRRATQVDPPLGGPNFAYIFESGTSRRSFQNATIEIAASSDEFELLAVPTGVGMATVAAGQGETTLALDRSSHVVRYGDDPSGPSAGETSYLGFWFETPADMLGAVRLDSATLAGDLIVFINNATVNVREDGRTVWQNWTGLRQETENGPASTYEERALVLRLSGASLSIDAPDAVAVLGPSFVAEVTGIVRSDQVEGRLLTPAGAIAFEDEPVEIEGRTSFTLGPSRARSGSSGSAMVLALKPGSDAVVRGGAPLSAASTAPAFPAGPAAAGGSVALALIIVFGAWVATRAGPPAVERFRERQYSRWLSRGLALSDARDFVSAASCFKRAVRVDARRGNAWHQLALALLEAGDHEAALQAVADSRDSPGVDRLDMLEIEIVAAFGAEDLERCRRAFADLAGQSQEMAAGLAADLDLGEEIVGSRFATARRSRGEGGLPGYA